MRRSYAAYAYAGGSLVLLILIALGWWYFTLRGEIQDMAAQDARRGIGQETPSFGSSIGSTYGNIVSTAANLFGAEPEENEGRQLPRLAQINKTPTAGMGFSSTTPLKLRFVERSTGYILESDVVEGNLTRLTNTLVPRTYEALVGDRIVLRTLEENGSITTVVGTIASSSDTTIGTFSSRRLPDGIRAIALARGAREAVYIAPSNDGSVVMRTDLITGKERQLLTSGIAGWHLRWTDGGRIVMTTNASSNANGYAYELKNDTLVPLVRDMQGLTTLPHPSGSAMLYGTSDGSLRARADERSTSIVLSVRTMPEKCVWAPGRALIVYCAVPQTVPTREFLDRWYRGEEHTVDTWWRIDVGANTAEMLYSPNAQLDVGKPSIDNGGNYIAFLNGYDRSLWLLRIQE
jgi:hypothetical protein